MWQALSRFCGALLEGDAGKVVEVLHESPDSPPEKPRAEGDPPCGKVDGETKTKCMGHGPGGSCVMGEVH